MTEPDGYVTRDGPDYDKYANAVLDSLQQQGRDFTDPDEAEEEAKRLAEMLVLDKDELVERARAAANAGKPQDGKNIGNINDVEAGV
jgi:hypothetical protein